MKSFCLPVIEFYFSSLGLPTILLSCLCVYGLGLGVSRLLAPFYHQQVHGALLCAQLALALHPHDPGSVFESYQ